MRHIVRLSCVLFFALLIGAPSVWAQRRGGDGNRGRGGDRGGRVERGDRGGNRDRGGRQEARRDRSRNHGRSHQHWFKGRHSQFRFHFRSRWYQGYWLRSYRPVCGRTYRVPMRRYWSNRLGRWVYANYVYVPFPCDYDYYYE